MPSLTQSLYAKSLSWLPVAQLPRHQGPPTLLQHWLTDSGSLTARLMARSNGDFRVEIVRQVIAIPTRDEQQLLHLKRPQLALIREVILFGQHEAWVFARSVLPLASLTGKLRHLRKQNLRPLGAFLFSQPHVIRGPIAVALINSHHGYLPAALASGRALWGRRSVFSVEKKPLLVSEVFLPAFCDRLT